MALTSIPFIPRPLLFAAGALVLLSLALATGYRAAGLPSAVVLEDAPPTVWRHLRFVDRSDGGIEVLDARSGQTIEVLHGEQGFVRGTLRGLAQERLRRGLGPERPFELQVTAGGRLALVDPATGRHVDLASFGRDNVLVFARWLRAPGTVPRSP